LEEIPKSTNSSSAWKPIVEWLFSNQSSHVITGMTELSPAEKYRSGRNSRACTRHIRTWLGVESKPGTSASSPFCRRLPLEHIESCAVSRPRKSLKTLIQPLTTVCNRLERYLDQSFRWVLQLQTRWSK
jgi:hypothetical protein